MKLRFDREWPALSALVVLYVFLAVAAPNFTNRYFSRLAVCDYECGVRGLGKSWPPATACGAGCDPDRRSAGRDERRLDLVRSRTFDCRDAGHYDRLARIFALDYGRRMGRRVTN